MPGSPSLLSCPTLTRYTIAVETTAQAQALQAFLWCLWLAALHARRHECTNAKGLLCSVSYSGPSTATTTKSTTYDQYSRPSITTTVIDGQSFVSSVAYDALGRPKYSIYPQATPQAFPLALQHFYSGAGYASEVKHATSGQSYWKVDARFADGQLQQATQGGVLSLSPSYDTVSMGRIAGLNVKNGFGGASLLTQNFTFESVGNLKSRTLTSTTGASAARTESESFGYDALDRLTTHTPTVGVTDAGSGSNVYDPAGNVTSKAGLALAYGSVGNRLCAINGTSCGAGTGAIGYDANGNIQSYTRPLTASTPGADGALLNLFEYSSFNMPRLITKSLNGAVVTSGEFFYDAGYQRVRQIKRTGAATVGTGNIADDVLYVVPGGFEVHRNAVGQIISSIATISGPDGVAATVSTSFETSTGLPVAQNLGANLSSDQSGSNTVTKLVLKDHLGSMVGEITLTGTVNASGQVTSMSVLTNTLVIHGFGPWGNARGVSPFAEGQRGFTGHEHLAELGIIHMNGRLYDAVLGRFLQADPIIQAPHNAQSHNRYSYVLNNPLSFTDPSGFSAWTQWRRPILAIAAAVLVPYLAGQLIFAQAAAGAQWALNMVTIVNSGGVGVAGLTATGNFAASVAGGFAAGGISGGNIQSALQGAFTAGLTFGVGELSGAHAAGGMAAMSAGQRVGQVAGHAAVGCISGAMAGGSCRAGAISAGVSAFAGHVPGVKETGLVGRVVIGAVASQLAGGKAQNGALSAAFEYLFNEAADRMVEKANGRQLLRPLADFPVNANSATPVIMLVDYRVVDQFNSFLGELTAEGIPVQVNDAFRTNGVQASLTGNSRGGAKYDSSLHEAGFAIDIAWNALTTQQREFALTAASRNGLQWGGPFTPPDPVHFFVDPFPNAVSRRAAINRAQNYYLGASQ